MQVGTTRIWGGFKYQKQRDGRWMKLRKAKPEEMSEPPPLDMPSGLAPPPQRKRVPSVQEITIPVGKEWRDSVSDLPESTTEEMFNEEGEPRPQRKALHERIFRVFLDHVEKVSDDFRSVAVVVMGGPASGRSAVGKALSATGNFVRSDPSTVTTLIPEYADAVRLLARNAADLASAEAGYVASSIMEKAVEARKNLVVEVVGGNGKKLVGLVSALQENDYYVVVLFLETTDDVARERADARGAQTGRWVPDKAFKLILKLPKTFERASQEADQAIVFDTNGAPKLKESALDSLRVIFERKEPSNLAVPVADIQKTALEGLKRERSRADSLTDKYKKSEGIWLAHYDDSHLDLDLSPDPDPEEA